MFSQTHLRQRFYRQKPDTPNHIPSSPTLEPEDETVGGIQDDVEQAAEQRSAAPTPTPSAPSRPTTATLNRAERTYSIATTTSSDADFSIHKLSRTPSIYTLGRSSLGAQLNKLTSVDLPDPASLSATVSAIPTALEACTTLSNAAPQIRQWIHTAAKVLGSLDAEDDIEWASDGKESVAEVDAAITKFTDLVNIYVKAIEELQKREDVDKVPSNQVKDVVATLEDILIPWGRVQHSLAAAKKQVELAVEWEEIWNKVMGDINNELTDLGRLVFEMEEKRHSASVEVEQADMLDMREELETIAEDGPEADTRSISRDVSPSAPTMPSLMLTNALTSPSVAAHPDDSGLMALFARMQPLQASLSFLPMRLASFRVRAEASFPSACGELEQRAAVLEERWKKLESDAETLRAELGEDRWVSVFRNVGRQAAKMCQSVERGIVKLQEAIDSGANLGTPAATLAKKISDYEAKKSNYGPAIQKIMGVIDRGIAERKTVNGEVLMIQQDTQRVWSALQLEMQDMDATLEELQSSRGGQQLRDSVSTIATQDMSLFESAGATPGSSPASSVVISAASQQPSSKGASKKPSLPLTPDSTTHRPSSRTASVSSTSRLPQGRRNVSLPVSSRYLSPRSTFTSRSNTPSVSTPRASFSSTSSTPTAFSHNQHRFAPHSAPPASNRPRWSGSTVVDYKNFGPHKRPDSRLYRGRVGQGGGYGSGSITGSAPASPLVREQTASPSPGGQTASSRGGRGSSRPPSRTSRLSGGSSLAAYVGSSKLRGEGSPSPARSTGTASGTMEARPRQHNPGSLMQSRLSVSSSNGSPSAALGARRNVTMPVMLDAAAAEELGDEDGVSDVTLESPTLLARPASRVRNGSLPKRASMLPIRSGADDKPKWKP